MAPELFAVCSDLFKADVWAYACVVEEILTLDFPFNKLGDATLRSRLIGNPESLPLPDLPVDCPVHNDWFALLDFARQVEVAARPTMAQLSVEVNQLLLHAEESEPGVIMRTVCSHQRKSRREQQLGQQAEEKGQMEASMVAKKQMENALPAPFWEARPSGRQQAAALAGAREGVRQSRPFNRCGAISQLGRQCPRMASGGRKYCHSHRPLESRGEDVKDEEDEEEQLQSGTRGEDAKEAAKEAAPPASPPVVVNVTNVVTGFFQGSGNTHDHSRSNGAGQHSDAAELMTARERELQRRERDREERDARMQRRAEMREAALREEQAKLARQRKAHKAAVAEERVRQAEEREARVREQLVRAEADKKAAEEAAQKAMKEANRCIRQQDEIRRLQQQADQERRDKERLEEELWRERQRRPEPSPAPPQQAMTQYVVVSAHGRGRSDGAATSLCTGFNKDGKPCGRPVRGGGRCWQHKSK